MAVLSYAQDNRVFKELVVRTDSVYVIDSVSISPFGFVVLTRDKDTVDVANFSVMFSSAKFTWKGRGKDTIYLNYRQLPFLFTKTYSHKDTAIRFLKEKNELKPIRYTSESSTTDLFGNYGLNKSGNISRGVMFGSAQNLSLNSNLNLQLSGKISNDIEILASITDDNLPIQPEGNTQQINEFDQVYIQLFSGDKWKLQAGDFWLKNPNNYFLKYNKKAQGASFYKRTKLNEQFIAKNKASIAVSKGKFARHILQGVEGNQGPYKLKGANNEQFIVILSGTERVFIDGKLLTRGAVNDYTIDYNTAEVTFTANQIITKDKRIIVEFQYSDKNYARSIVESTNEFVSKKSRWYVNVYSEQDAKNQPLQQDLSNAEKSFLAQIGDSIAQAYFPSFDSVEYNSNQVLYKKIDSLGYSIFVYSNSPDSAHYNVYFSKIEGDYVLDDFVAFGKVYKWVAPDTVAGKLVHKGEYAPVRILIAPQKHQFVSAGTEQHISKNTSLKVETALSNKDINTFSNKDSKDNLGGGFMLSLVHKKDSVFKNWTLQNTVNAEVRTQYFSPVQWYRSPEFIRDWNIKGVNTQAFQTLGNAEVKLFRKQNAFTYGIKNYTIDKAYSGIKNYIRINSSTQKGLFIDFKGSFLHSEGNYTSNYIRHKTNIYQSIKKWKVGFKDIHENNQKKVADSLSSGSYQFYDWRTYVSKGDSGSSFVEVYYGQRSDKKPLLNELSSATFAENIGGKWVKRFSARHQITVNTNYRTLTIKDTNLVSLRPENTLLSRITHRIKLLKGGVNFSTFYEIGSGLELKKEFTYIEVTAGQGTYTWNDYNNDGVKQLNEFEVAVFSDQAKYIRVFTPSNNYVKTYNSGFNEVVNINPRYFLKKKSKVNKFINRFTTQTRLRSNRKTTLKNIENYANPFIQNIVDSSLLSLQNSFRNSVYFNRSNPKFGIEYTYISTQNKTLLVNGFDSKIRKNNEVNIRWNITPNFLFQIKQALENKQSSADYANNRNYNIEAIKTEGKLSFQPSTRYRVSVITAYKDKRNLLPSAEKVFINQYGLEMKYNSLKKGIITASFNYINNIYIGSENQAVSFEMLEALQKGKNFTWVCSIQRTLANNLQLTLNYNGRSSKNNPIVHTGGVQVRAFF